MVIRMELTKGAPVRYISHLDYAGLLQRAIRRAQIPAAYSEGFNPHMKLSFASALPLGMTAKSVYADLELKKQMPVGKFCAVLNEALLPGVMLLRAVILPEGKKETLASLATQAVYLATLPNVTAEEAERAVAEFNAAQGLYCEREKKVKSKKRHVKPQVVKKTLLLDDYLLAPLSLENGLLRLSLKVSQGGSIKPSEVLGVFHDQFLPQLDLADVMLERQALLHDDKSIF